MEAEVGIIQYGKLGDKEKNWGSRIMSPQAKNSTIFKTNIHYFDKHFIINSYVSGKK